MKINYLRKVCQQGMVLHPYRPKELCFMMPPKPDSPRGQDQQRTWRWGEMVGYYLVHEVWRGWHWSS